MAPKRGADWANTQLKNLHTDLKTLQTSLANLSSSGAEKGGRKKEGKSIQEASDLVRESLKEVAEHPYNQVGSSVNPGDKSLAPEVRYPARCLYKEPKGFLESPDSSDPEAFEKDVRKHLKSLVSVLDPTHLLLKTTKADKQTLRHTPYTRNYGCDILCCQRAGATGEEAEATARAAQEDVNEESLLDAGIGVGQEEQT